MVSQNVSRMESSHQTRDLDCFADKYNIPWNLPTNFHPDPIATVPQTCLLSLCALLSPQPHLFVICVVLTYNDSKKNLHRLCQIPRNCHCKWLWTFHSAPTTFASFSVFLVKFLFCTDTTRSIGWPSPAPRWDIDDCFEIHIILWELCDFAVIKSPKFSARSTAPLLRLLHGTLVILVLWQISQFRF